MTTFLVQVLNELEAGHDGPEIPESKRLYFQRRLRDRFFDFLRERFEREEANGLTQAKLARRIGKSPEVINRWLNASSNLTLDSISDLMIGVAAEEPEFDGKSLLNRPDSNYIHLDESEGIASAQLPEIEQEDGDMVSALSSANLIPRQSRNPNSVRINAQDKAYSDRGRKR
jgi:transcriptional regulator with XRE-family HTH domain